MKHIKLITCLLLCACLSFFSGCGNGGGTIKESETSEDNSYVQKVFSSAPQYVKKTETVYVTMNADGSIAGDVVVTDWLHTSSANVRVEDVSDLSGIKNVKGDILPVVSENSSLVWHMDTTDLYYTGVTQREPPVKFEFEFFMNGIEYSPESIKGKSGRVIINIKAINNDVRTKQIGGKSVKIYNPFIVVGGTVFSQKNFSAVSVEGGRSIGDGKKELVFGVMLPGITESLGLTGDDLLSLGTLKLSDSFSVTADVTDFSLGQMYFAVLPVTSLDIGTSFSQTVGDMSDSLSKLDELRAGFESSGVQELLSSLTGDAGAMAELTSALNDATALIADNKKLLETLSKYVTTENLEHIKTATEEAKNLEIGEYLELLADEQFQDFLLNFSSAAQGMSSLLPLFEQLSADLNDEEIRAALDKLPQTVEKLSQIRATFEENEDFLSSITQLLQGDSVKNLSQLSQSLGSVLSNDAIDKLSALADNADELIARAKECLLAGSEYKIFTKAAPGSDTSVMFIYETEPIA